MKWIPKKYKFKRVAFVDANGKPTKLQTGELKEFEGFTVWAFSESHAMRRAAKKAGYYFTAVKL